MAILSITGLETHPVGTAGMNGIINGNYDRLEAIFQPLAGGVEPGLIGWNHSNQQFSVGAAQTAIQPTATPILNLLGSKIQTLILNSNVTFTTLNRAAGREIKVIITADSALRTLAWPAGWVWIGGTAPANIAANKTAMLELISTTTADTGAVARWTVQP